MTLLLPRRAFTLGLAAAVLSPTAYVFGAEPVALMEGADVTADLEQLLARNPGGSVQLPAGRFRIAGLNLPSGTRLVGMGPATVLEGYLSIEGAEDVTLAELTLRGASGGSSGSLISVSGSANLRLDGLVLRDGGIGLDAYASSGMVTNCRFHHFADAAVHSLDGLGLTISGCAIENCGNAGIRIWRSSPGLDGSIIIANRFADIDWRDGGNGQNGNGVNVFRADGVIVSDNQFDRCAFTAVRLNAATSTIVRGNSCRASGEVAIFSEFEFSGSVIADNLIDGAAAGISMTNLDSGGHLASCTGNIVRNLYARSDVNPDTTPYGIAAEADAIISGNAVSVVPGIGIAAGYGPFLRNVAIVGNVVSDCEIGIGVSIAPGAGAVHLADNLISRSKLAIAGLAWDEVVERDLVDGAHFPHVSVANNRVGM